ncbi:hypothetical protein [Anaeromyxobacter paludicola]|uniref:Uncharacterized protein n=1 Tax=Anaeromyxobacter paludicola TaxID=2918171 RepID=A0ABN6N9M6_9BACT|nr:hypothetical protein [Anaeromyxobacter paludicola]BDG08819.1 hypothetical protein AMPC_19320 [Anaeromyxobacter paludicola]
MTFRRAILAVLVLALGGGASVVGAVLARHPSRLFAGRAYRSPEARAALRRALEGRREALARAAEGAGRAVEAAAGGDPRAPIRALAAGQALAHATSALLPLVEPPARPELERQFALLHRSLADLDRRSAAGAWAEAAGTPAVACAAACLAPRDRCWAAAGPHAPRCEGLGLEAAACAIRCR